MLFIGQTKKTNKDMDLDNAFRWPRQNKAVDLGFVLCRLASLSLSLTTQEQLWGG